MQAQRNEAGYGKIANELAPGAAEETEPMAVDGAVLALKSRISRDRAAAIVLAEVARDFDTAPDLLLSTVRCSQPVALARQVAMYLLHVELGRLMHDVGRLLGRDRTTVSHACAHVEDLRENGRFDARIDAIELAIRARMAAPAVMEASDARVA